MNDHPIQVLFVGCGAFAHRYHVPALIEDETLSVAAIFDPSPSDKTRALAQRYRAPVVARLEDLPQPRSRSSPRRTRCTPGMSMPCSIARCTCSSTSHS